MSDYPKIMTRGGEEISVGGEAEETEKRAEGWCSPLDVAPEVDADAPAVPDVDPDASSDDEPTFGPPHDQTHAKRPARSGASKKR